MTTKEAFTDEEWTRICRAPFVAGLAITIADPGGPIEISKEGMATLKAPRVPPDGEGRATVTPPWPPGSREELLTAVALDIESMIQSKHNPAKDFKPKAAPTAGAEILDELRAVDGIVAGKATPEETEGFRNWLVATAQAAADAAKEGG